MAADISYEQHLQQNNERLVSITKQLGDVCGYERGCRELIAWCTDPRAFHSAFEENLISALGEVVNVSSRDGFDRELAASLISCCHVHRKLLSRSSTTRINRWYEQLRRLKRSTSAGGGANAAKKQRAGGDPKKSNLQCAVEAADAFSHADPQLRDDRFVSLAGAPTHPSATPTANDLREGSGIGEGGESSTASLMWSYPTGAGVVATGGGVAASGAQQSSFGAVAGDYAGMSAIAALSPVPSQDVHSTQMSHIAPNPLRYPQHYLHGPMAASPSFAGTCVMPQQSYPLDPASARSCTYPPNQGTAYISSGGFDQGMVSGAMQSGYGVSSQQIMMEQNSMMHMGYRPQQAYPSTQQMRMYGQQRAVAMQQPQAMAAVAAAPQQSMFDPSTYPSGIPCATQRTPGMPGIQSSHMGGGTSQMRPVMPMMFPASNGMMLSPNQNMATSSSCYSRARANAAMSPAYAMNVPSYSQGQPMMSYVMNVGSPMLYSQMQGDVTRQQVVAYPNPNVPHREQTNGMVRIPSPLSASEPKVAAFVEVLLPPFCLSHEATTSDYNFSLSQDRVDLIRKSELEVQLKCIHKDRRQQLWPTVTDLSTEPSIKVFVNGASVPITAVEGPLYVGRYCVVGSNKLVITVCKCVCSHSFVMQLVNRRPIELVVNEIFMQSRMTANPIVARDKLLKMIEMDASQSRVPLYFPMANCSQRLRIPARCNRCTHSSCFDLETFLLQNQDNTCLECPLTCCKLVFMLNEIEVDQYICEILAETSRMPNVFEVSVEPTSGRWRVVDPLATMNAHTSLEYPSAPVDAPRALKRDRDAVDSSSSGAGCYSLKRIKSDTFAANGAVGGNKAEPLGQSPFNPNSVPAPPSGSWLQSPTGVLPSVLSPYGPSSCASPSLAQSAAHPRGPPSAPPKYGGPGTPSTPSNAQNPPSIGPVLGTSPGSTQTHAIGQQQGSVEAVSVAGSAPYTPASVGSSSCGGHSALPAAAVAAGGTETAGSQNATATHSLSDISCSINFGTMDDFYDDLIFSDAKMSSAAEMQKYLNEDFLTGTGLSEINAALKCEGNGSTSENETQDWNDVAQVIAEQS